MTAYNGEPSDNLWGETKWLTGLEEDMYIVYLSTNDLTTGTHYLNPIESRFTTKGPITFDSMNVTEGNENPSPPERIKFSLALRNNGIIDTIYDVDVNIILPDNPFIVNSTTGTPKFGNIAPGESLSSSSRDFAITFLDSCEDGSYEFGLEITSNDYIYWHDTFTIDVITGIENELHALPKKFALEQNFPNPFNPSTKIKYSIPKQSNVTLKVFDVLGKEIATLINKEQSQGNYEIEWDAANSTSGIYCYKLTTGEYAETKKMLLLR